MRKVWEQTLSHIRQHYQAIFVLIMATFFILLAANFVIVGRENSRVFSLSESDGIAALDDIRIGIVFGGGVHYGQPLPLLTDRLETAKKLLDNGTVDKLLLSGDNREVSYNEPLAMMDYLIDTLQVDPSKLQPDFAGRSTYETCERAKKVFSIDRAILITESTHLPRAIYLCRHFDIDAFGVSSDGESSSGPKVGQRWREVWARSKAIFNAYVIGEDTVLGEQINL